MGLFLHRIHIAVGCDQLLVVVEAVLAVALIGAAALVVQIDIDKAVALAVCIKMVDDATEEGNAVQQGRAVQVLMDIFKARYAALVSCVQGDQSAAQGSF